MMFAGTTWAPPDIRSATRRTSIESPAKACGSATRIRRRRLHAIALRPFLYAFIDGDRIPVPPTGLLDESQLQRATARRVINGQAQMTTWAGVYSYTASGKPGKPCRLYRL